MGKTAEDSSVVVQATIGETSISAMEAAVFRTEVRAVMEALPTIELVINSLPNSSTSFSPFYLNYGYEPVTPIQLLRRDELPKTKSVASFVQRVASD